jgi:tetratricopeptide (TPR) repeat protein
LLGLLCLALLPLASGGYSGWGYQLGFVLLPLAALLCLPALRLERLAQLALTAFLLSPLLLFAPFMPWTHSGATLWFSLLALPCGWIIARSLQQHDRGLTRYVLPTITLSAVLTALAGLFPWWGHWLNYGDFDYHVVSTFGLHNAYAGYLLLAWPVGLMAALQARSKAGRIAGWAATLLLTATLVLTGSRAAAFVFALQLLFVVALWLVRRLRWSGPVSWSATLLGLLMPVAAALVYVTRNLDYSLQGRLRFWDASLEMLAQHPLTGVGLGGFGYAFPQLQPDWRYYSVDPHSWLLQLPAELGLLGVLIAAACVAGFMLWARGALSISSLLVAAVAGSLLHAAFDFDYTFAATTLLLGVLLGWGSRVGANSGVDQAEPSTQGPPRKVWRGLAVAALLVALVFGQLLTLERFTLDALRVARGPQRQSELLEQAVRLVPWNERTQLMLAEALAQVEGKNSERARTYVERALQLEPRLSGAWALRAALQREPVDADSDFARAIELDPYNHPEYYFAWATAAQTAEQRYERLKLGVERIPAEHPITPDHIRAPDWYQFNPLWARWWQQLAELERDPAQQKNYAEISQRFQDYVQRQVSEQQERPRSPDKVRPSSGR